MSAPRLSRRSLLLGAGGAAVALPLLECMGGARAAAATVPRRYVVCFGGFSLTNDAAPAGAQGFIPNTIGPGYDLKRALTPLGGFPDAAKNPVKQQVSVVSGLTIPDAQVPGGRAGGTDGFHWHCNPLLTGTRQVATTDSKVTAASSDQVVAAAVGGGTRFASLSYRVQASQYVNGAKAETQLDRSTLSFAQQGGQIVRVLPQTSPKQAFGGLFTGFIPTNIASADASRLALELQKCKSVLDTVDRSFAGLLPRMGQWDRQRLQRHYDEVRALEKLLATPAPMTGGACQLPADPGADPPVGGDFDGPMGWSSSGGYSQEDERAHAFAKLVHMALVCDLTRSVTLMYTMFPSFMNAYPLVGEQFNAHELNHKSGQAPLDKMIAWHVGHFGELVALLRDTPENGGSLLDSCAMVLLNEGGDGYGAVEGSHSTERMACLIAGGASGLRRGEHIVAPKGTHPAQVLTTLMTAVGAPVTGLGEIAGTVPALLR